MSTLPVKTAAVIGLASMLVAGTSIAASAATKHGRAGVAIHTTHRHGVAAPATMRPGLVRLRNTGSDPVYVIEKTHAGVKTLVSDLTRSASAGGPGRLITDFVLRDLVFPHSDGYLRLDRATYYLADASLEHYTAGEFRTAHVTGQRIDAALPSAATVSINRNDTLTTPARVPSSRRYLHVKNDSAHLQDVLVVGVGSDVAITSVNAFIAHPSFAHLDDLQPTSAGPAGLVGAHRSAWVGQHLHPGRYLVMTVAFTAHTTMPALRKNRVRLVTVR